VHLEPLIAAALGLGDLDKVLSLCDKWRRLPTLLDWLDAGVPPTYRAATADDLRPPLVASWWSMTESVHALGPLRTVRLFRAAGFRDGYRRDDATGRTAYRVPRLPDLTTPRCVVNAGSGASHLVRPAPRLGVRHRVCARLPSHDPT
jgi:hypothetical protein